MPSLPILPNSRRVVIVLLFVLLTAGCHDETPPSEIVTVPSPAAPTAAVVLPPVKPLGFYGPQPLLTAKPIVKSKPIKPVAKLKPAAKLKPVPKLIPTRTYKPLRKYRRGRKYRPVRRARRRR